MSYYQMHLIIQANWLKDSIEQDKTSIYGEKVQDYNDGSRLYFIKCDFVTGCQEIKFGILVKLLNF